MPGPKGRAHKAALQIRDLQAPKPGGTPKDLYKHLGKYISPKAIDKQGKKPLTLKEFLPGYSCSRKPLKIISPSAKRMINNKVVATELKNLGTTVGHESKVKHSFDNDAYIKSLAEQAKGLRD